MELIVADCLVSFFKLTCSNCLEFFVCFLQQAKVIAESINFKVAIHCGGDRTVKTHSDWVREVSENEVISLLSFYLFNPISLVKLIVNSILHFRGNHRFDLWDHYSIFLLFEAECFLQVLVMTPQILLHNLQHCFIRMEWISLLIFDECHHAQVQSNHPYAQIMKVSFSTFLVYGV